MEKSESLDQVPEWPIIQDAKTLEVWINAASNEATRDSRVADTIATLDERWPHHGEFFHIVGRCLVPEEPANPYDLDWVEDQEIAGLSMGFQALLNEQNEIEVGLLFLTHTVQINMPQKSADIQAHSFVRLSEPFTVLEHESDIISALRPEQLLSHEPDEHFSFRRYNTIGHKFIYGDGHTASEAKKSKALNYIRQRWPYGECEMSVSAEYAYQLIWGEQFFVDNMHLFSHRQPIRGTLLDFGFYPHRITSDGAIVRGATKFGTETLSLVIQPDEPEQFYLRPNGVLVVPTSQRLSAVVHDFDHDIVIK